MDHHRMRHLGQTALIGLVVVAFATVARAEDRHAWFKSLTMPGTNASCCDISDCRQTKADWRAGQWWATVDGQWTPIPPDRELSKRSIDGEAYVCAGPSHYVYCFIKPDTLM